MSVIQDVIKLEWKLMRRNVIAAWLPIMHALLWLLMIVNYEISPVGKGTRAYYFYYEWMRMIPIVVLLAGWVGVYVMYRDRHNGLNTLYKTWSSQASLIVTGKWLFIQLYGLLLTVPLVLIQSLWLAVASPMEHFVLHGTYTFIQTGVAVMLFGSLGVCLGVLIRGKASFLLMLAVGGAHILHVLNTGRNESVHVMWRWFSPYDLTHFIYNVIYDSHGLWGLVPWTAVHQFAASGAAVLLLVLACFTANIRRMDRRATRPYVAAGILVLLITVSAGGVSYYELAQRVNVYVSEAETYRKAGTDLSSISGGVAEVKNDFHPDRIRLRIELGNKGELEAASELELRHTGKHQASRLFLTLNSRLRVTRLESDIPLDWSRQGDILELNIQKPMQKGESVRIRMDYSGNMNILRGEGTRLYSRISGENAVLPKSAGWYPQIGKRHLVVWEEHNTSPLGFRLKEDVPYSEPGTTQYTVQILGLQGTPILPLPLVREGESVIYEGKNNMGLFLYHGILEEREVNGARVVDHPDRIREAVEGAKTQMQQIQYLNDWLGLRMMPPNLYSGYMPGFLPAPRSSGPEIFQIRSPRDYVELPAVQHPILDGLLHWIYEKEYPRKNISWNADFKTYFTRNYSIRNNSTNIYPGGTLKKSLSADDERRMEEISKLAEKDWNRIMTSAGEVYRMYQTERDPEMNVLKELLSIFKLTGTGDEA